MVVFFVFLEMISQGYDAGGQNCHLHFGEPVSFSVCLYSPINSVLRSAVIDIEISYLNNILQIKNPNRPNFPSMNFGQCYRPAVGRRVYGSLDAMRNPDGLSKT